ncbi:polysaccharide biosynthesis protein [Paenilisteria newyorkensis]|uniref:polysaccharide biosynthesis protein n=1 Tax=Listeria newyorkensis TaxID=1497681 RepID=UPI00066A11A5|nr:nucleoside-diphosphate sugar epimerase/dehydratase [Listeria newyorkensis]KMT62149.1 polysaccharide biosynthesis protein CapD [Listeria newyorkensis]
MLKRTLIIGGGEAAQYVFHTIAKDETMNYQIIGILDDSPEVQLREVTRLGVLSELEETIINESITSVFLAIPSLEICKRKHILEICQKYKMETKVLPKLQDIHSKKDKLTLRAVSYQDIIDRAEFELDYLMVEQEVANKTILITGAGGSIGSEITRQLMNAHPKKLVLLGHGEASIYEIHRELQKMNHQTELIPCIADIQNEQRLAEIFSEHSPDIVYHAAAHKHVPLMEKNITEAIANNAKGTCNLASISHTHDVEKFVMISTDKAVKPTTVMGASKRMAEKIVQLFNQKSKTLFCVVRFGNVLGSSGSVVPLFYEQICNDEPVTLTHPDMERYFMTIPEASKLVIQASMITNGGEIFVLDMGEPIKIMDVIYKLIDLTGKDRESVQIDFIGIRQGEKVREELFESDEKAHTQIFEKILVGEGHPSPSELQNIQALLGSYMDMTDERRKERLFELIEADWRYTKI